MRKGIKSIKRGIAVLLSACMVFGMTPIQAGAENTSGNETQANDSAEADTATSDHYDANGFCKGYEIASDGSGAWVPKSGDEACTDENCNGYQPMTKVTENGTTWYEISNAGQLYWFADQVDNGNLLDANIRLTADIVDNEGVTFGWDEENDYAMVATKDGKSVDAKTLRMWNPIGDLNSQYEFEGHFDGQGHSISGLYHSGKQSGQVGIFQKLMGKSADKHVIVERTGLENSYLRGENQAGGIVGYAENATIKQCYNAAYILASRRVGGLIAALDKNIKLSELYNVGKLTVVGENDDRYIGYIAGKLGTWAELIQFNSCYVCSDVNISLLGNQSGYDTEDAFLSHESFYNGEVAYLLSQSSSTWGQNLSSKNSLPRPCASDKYLVYKTCEREYTNDVSKVHHSIVNGLCTNAGCDYYEGEPHYNEQEGVYEISNAGQLYDYANKAQTVYTKGAKLMADIVVNKDALIQADGTPVTDTADIRTWNGLFRVRGRSKALTFDGNNHSISGLYAKGSGLQGFVLHNPGTVKNLQIKNSVFISTDGTAGGIVAGDTSYTATFKIQNCSFEGYVEGAVYAGGIAGENAHTSNCYADAYVAGSGVISPIVAHPSITGSAGTITNTAYNTDKYKADCTTTGIQGFTTDQFASGEVAYALNHPDSDVTTDTWKQTLDGESKDSTPTLNTAKENVYRYERLRCDGATKTTDIYGYTNDSFKSGTSIPDAHTYEIDDNDHTHHKCSVCKTATESHTYTYKVVEGKSDTIRAVCDVCGDSYTVKIAAPTGAEGKLTYDGTEKAATTKITDGALGEILPAIEYATVVDGVVSSYSTDVPKNGGSYKARLTLETGENVVSATVDYEIAKATPFIALKPDAAAITYGQSLADSALTGGKATYQDADGEEITGTFAWKDGNSKPAVSDSDVTAYEVIFTPDDTVDYRTVETSVTLAVTKAAQAPDMPNETMMAAHSAGTVGAAVLPDGWSWLEEDKDTVLAVNTPITVTAVYTGADRGNYEVESVSITLTRKECDRQNTVVKDQIPATCTANGYSGDTYCADCGAFIEHGTETEALGHTYGTPQYSWTTDATGKMTCTASKTCTRTGCADTEADHSITETVTATDTVTEEPTCTVKGTRTYTAVFTVDGFTTQTRTEDIATTAHKLTAVAAKEATATIAGNKAYFVCDICGKYFEDSEGTVEIVDKNSVVIPAKGTTPVVPGGTNTRTPSVPRPGNAGGSNIPSRTAKPNGTKFKDSTGAVYKVTDAKSKTPTVQYMTPKSGATGTVTIPATVTIDKVTYKVTSIADNAFRGNKKIKKVVIGSNIVSIGKNAFAKCTNLTSITIGKNVTKIGKNVFNGCKKLKTLIIKSKKLTAKSVAKGAFKGIGKKAVVKVPKSKYKAYKKLLRAKGLSKKLKFKKQ